MQKYDIYYLKIEKKLTFFIYILIRKFFLIILNLLLAK